MERHRVLQISSFLLNQSGRNDGSRNYRSVTLSHYTASEGSLLSFVKALILLALQRCIVQNQRQNRAGPGEVDSAKAQHVKSRKITVS